MVDAGKKVIVTGCLSQKHNQDLKEAIPELAGMIGTANLNDLVKVIKDIEKDTEEKMAKYAALLGGFGF